MTEKKKHFVSLSVKPLFVLLLGLVLGVCVCLLANFTGEQIIERSYMSDKAVLKRTNRAAQEFQAFVRQNSISTRYTENGKFTAEVILPIRAETMPSE